MGRRTYGQLCGIASALDVLGERWTLLVVRELLLGPQRFSELLANLDGIGPNLLTERLRSLAEHGVIEGVATAAATAQDGRARSYRLTELGEQLREPVLQLGHWGMALLDGDENRQARAHWGFLAVQTMVRGNPVPDADEEYEFRIDGLHFHIAVEAGRPTARKGPADRPAMVATSDAHTFVRIGAALITPFEAVTAGRLVLDGDPDAVVRCSRLLGLLP
ncbi:helix-turn-helix domain-containing protein [Kitasatospora sp. NPDC002040]|uniref:helix-turn-helix domain-containing protein n=1 Tax=Kitasatospora sp. NPDC002040 TaxID=3154661 RepID=UPI0033348CF4